MKKRVFGSILGVALALSVVFGLFTACGSVDGEVYTVTFRDGTVIVSLVEVGAGDAIAEEDIPAAPAGHDGTFEGWFIGTVQVTAGYIPTESCTALAKFTAPSQATKYFVTVAEGDYTVEGLDEDGYEAGDEVTFSRSKVTTNSPMTSA